MFKKLLYFCLKVITLGGYLTKKKAQQEAQQINTTLKRSTTTDLNILSLIERLGGSVNIHQLRSRINLIIVTVADPKLIDLNGLKKSGAKGIMVNNKEIRIILGDDSQVVADQMNKIINKAKPSDK